MYLYFPNRPLISSHVQPCPISDYTFPAPGVYSNFLIVFIFTVQSHFSTSQFLSFHCVRVSVLKTFYVLNEGDDFDLLNCNWIVCIPLLWYCCGVSFIDIAIQCYIRSIYRYNMFSLLCTLCSQLSHFLCLSFPVFRGNLGLVHVEISQFNCIFWHTSHPTALLV
jgi:hypothetical protein